MSKKLPTAENIIETAKSGTHPKALSDAAAVDFRDKDAAKYETPPPIATASSARIANLEQRVADLEALIGHWHSIYQWPTPQPPQAPDALTQEQ